MDKNSKDLVGEMRGFWAEFETEFSTYTEKQKFSSAGHARKSLGELRKLVTPFRRALIEEVKAERAALKKSKSKAKKSAKTAKAPKAPKAPKVVEADETE